MVINGDILVKFINILSTKSMLSQKLKIEKSEDYFLLSVKTLRNFLNQKPNLVTDEGGGGSACR